MTVVDRDMKRMASVEEMRVLFRQQRYHEIAEKFEHLELDDLTGWELFWLTESTYTVRFILYIFINMIFAMIMIRYGQRHIQTSHSLECKLNS